MAIRINRFSRAPREPNVRYMNDALVGPSRSMRAAKAPRWLSVVLLLLLAVVVVYAAVPNLDGVCRPNANDNAAVAALKNIAVAQARVQAQAVIDCNHNGRGEYATFAELAATVPLRSSSGDGAVVILDPPSLFASFGKLVGGRVLRSGYAFQMFLPGRDVAWLGADTPSVASGIDADRAEGNWICYAWPLQPGVSGYRTYVIDAHGNLFGSLADEQAYGSAHAPVPGVAAHVCVDGTWLFAANTADVFGDVWIAVG